MSAENAVWFKGYLAGMRDARTIALDHIRFHSEWPSDASHDTLCAEEIATAIEAALQAEARERA